MRNTLNALDESVIGELMHRLEARGNSAKKVEKAIGRRTDDNEKHEKAKEKKKDFNASLEAYAVGDYVTEVNEEIYEDMDRQRVEFAEALKNLPQPVVHVHPQINLPLTKKVPVRDENGIIIEVREEPVG